MCYLLFHLLFTRIILGPPRSKAGTYTQNNWFYLIAAARNSSGRCLSNLSESTPSLHIDFPVTFFLFFPPPLIYYLHKFLYQSYTCFYTFTYIYTGLFTPAVHAYKLRPLRAPQARASQLNSPAPSPPGLNFCRALSPAWAGPATAPLCRAPLC